MTDTTLQLGDFTFARFEIPEDIPFGGGQKLIVHELVGGKRIIDAMGEVPRSPEWSGFFVGSSALDRALFIDGLRKAGKPLSLTWSELSYQVVIKDFECRFVRAYRLPYRIQLEVLSDDTTPITQITDPSPEQLIGDDLDGAGLLSDLIGDSGLSSLMGTLSGAVSLVGNLSAAAPSALATILLPLDQARDRVDDLMAGNDAIIGGMGGLAGVLPGGLLSDQVAGLTGAITAVSQQPVLLNLDRTLGRVAANIGAINGGTKSLTVAGGNLYTIAADQYGDPMGWTALAIANKLSDPQLTGIETLTVPPFTNDTGGVLSG